MRGYFKIIIATTLFFSGYRCKAQDTAAMVKEFNQVLSFAVRPYLYYNTHIKMNASPVMQPQDTVSMEGEFYKNETNIYYRTSQDEVYLEDSFFIQLNYLRKTILISKVDVNTKDKMNILPLDNKELQAIFRKEYVISKIASGEKSSTLNLEARQNNERSATVTVNVGLQYSTEKMLPELLKMNVLMKQQVNDETVQQMKNENANTLLSIQISGDKKYFVRNQSVSISFENIDNTKEKAVQIPSWKKVLAYDNKTNQFSGKGVYMDYEITKTF